MSIPALKGGHVEGAAVVLGEEERGGREAACSRKGSCAGGKVFLPAVGGCTSVSISLRDTAAPVLSITPIQAIARSGEALLDHFRGMPLASNHHPLEMAFHFEEHVESSRKGKHMHCHSPANRIRNINIGILQVTSGFMQVLHLPRNEIIRSKVNYSMSIDWINQFSAICMG